MSVFKLSHYLYLCYVLFMFSVLRLSSDPDDSLQPSG